MIVSVALFYIFDPDHFTLFTFPLCMQISLNPEQQDIPGDDGLQCDYYSLILRVVDKFCKTLMLSFHQPWRAHLIGQCSQMEIIPSMQFYVCSCVKHLFSLY